MAFKRYVGNSIPKVVEELPNGCLSIREDGQTVGEGLIFSLESADELESILDLWLGKDDPAPEPEPPVVNRYTVTFVYPPKTASDISYEV